MKRVRWLALAAVFALVIAACGDGEGGETTTTAGGETTSTGAEATTTSVAPGTPFEGLTLDSGGCGRELGYDDPATGEPATYTGRVNTLTAVDELTVEFALCGPHPAFLA
ncbi:MAG TPA: hypothetical protein VIH55_06685, partial [Acidimicrobiia bacterium]